MTKLKGILVRLSASHKLQASRRPAGPQPIYSKLFTCCLTTDNYREGIRESKKELSFLFREEGRTRQARTKIFTTDGYTVTSESVQLFFKLIKKN